ncbi:pyridoxal-dependent decarboxylase [Hyphococcus flavus]|uniref:Pyridoxal-dependent decarboxylase n=1 Tax=Hyphococcus flavus TaxID=1866326 RepID=A0AAE9ZAB4_9PROT|nr:pyridoxal-dependent decarboxylase [Hyphococcus flavus]WDI30564.1 pyridoxal-dependent decarboxylase [Hyphococcus flavus]
MSDDLQQRLLEEQQDARALTRAFEYAKAFVEYASTRRPYPYETAIGKARGATSHLPQRGQDADSVIDELQEKFSNACVNSIGGRYFGFVTGGVLPVARAARLLSDTWDQNAPLFRTSPAASAVEDICEDWLRTLFGLPPETVAGFVSGSSLAIYCGLAAARWRLLQRQGWDINAKGLAGAPSLRVIAGEQAHATVVKAVTLLGLGTDNIEWVETGRDGRIATDKVPPLDERTMLLLQAGNVNGGAFDDFKILCAKANDAGAWVHVDGAFGLWAAAAKQYAHLTEGMNNAMSWSCDAHKTLNTPYDCGVVFCRDREALNTALHATGSYLEHGADRDGMFFTPELSRRARAFDVWAALSYLGRDGVDNLVSLLCERASQFAQEITEAGFELAAEPSFNQLMFACKSDEETNSVLRAVQEGGECWAAGAEWFGRRVIRISVCSWATTPEDIKRSVDAFKAARAELG